MGTPSLVSLFALTMEAMPKSTRIARPPSRTRTLPGFTSRCTTPARCTAWRPWRIWRPMSAARGTPRTRSWRSRSASDRPSSSFITIQTWSSVSTWSWTVTTFWCSTLARALASRRARSLAACCVSADLPVWPSSPFMATKRSSLRSYALLTSPIPPLPIVSRSSKRSWITV